jgi:hypothetical protein
MNLLERYNQFLKTKEGVNYACGFTPTDLHPQLKDFQKFSVSIALQKGKFALFEDCGLGKTFQEIEWSRHVSNHTGKPVLNLAPLAVVSQTINEGKKFGIDVKEADQSNSPIQITNYEQLKNLSDDFINGLGGIVVDESSILKNFEGAYRNLIIDRFRNTPFKLAGTATPSPNDPMELGNHFEFLNVMTRQEMLATYFVHDGGDTQSWRLKGHAQDDFWRSVANCSLTFSKPSDLGFDDDGYILPKLNLFEQQIITPQRQGRLFNDVAVSSTNFHQEVKLSAVQRLSEVVNIVNSSKESFIVWVEHDDDGDYLEKHIRGAIQVKGSHKPEYKKSKLLGFQKDEFRVLITKPKIGSFGLNYQNCHNMVFASPDFSFEKLYQAIRRQLRYGQLHAVNVWIIITDTMQSVLQALKIKESQDYQMKQQLIKFNKELYGQYRKAA